MKFTTTRFGTIDVHEGDIVVFPSGILGFPESRRFVLIPHPGGGPYCWLQSLEMSEVAFVICDPQVMVPDYQIKIKIEELSLIQATNLEDLRVYAILRVPPKPKNPTINLIGPLIFNPQKSLGMQYVLNGSSWSHQHEIKACSS